MPSRGSIDASTPLPPHLDPRGRHRGSRAGASSSAAAKRPLHSSAARIALSIGAVISVGLLLVAGYAFFTYRNLDNGITRIEVAALGQAPKGIKHQKAYHYNGKDENILLVGNDDRTEMTDAESRALHAAKDGGSINTDTMMILHLPADGKKATLISLPRDSYVDIAGYGMNRLNSAYAYGYNNDTNGSRNERRSAGMNLLISTVTNLTGLTINHYMQVTLLGFYEISNALGGVPIDLCESTDDTHAANAAAGLTGGSGFKMSKGKHKIEGVTALEFVRQRHFLNGGDLDRVKRQQYFLTAAFRQVASVGILNKLNALSTAIHRTVTLDPGLDLLNLARQLENLSANNITGKTIPTTIADIGGNSVLQVDPAAVRASISKALNPPAPSPSAGKSTAPKKKATKAIDSKCIH